MVKIGDKVRATENHNDITKGNVYTVLHIGNDGSYKVRDDVGEDNWLLHAGIVTPVGDDDELIALRAWKASAIARFPALEQPETDEEAAERFKLDYYDGRLSSVTDIVKAAIAWARVNNR